MTTPLHRTEVEAARAGSTTGEATACWMRCRRRSASFGWVTGSWSAIALLALVAAGAVAPLLHRQEVGAAERSTKGLGDRALLRNRLRPVRRR